MNDDEYRAAALGDWQDRMKLEPKDPDPSPDKLGDVEQSESWEWPKRAPANKNVALSSYVHGRIIATETTFVDDVRAQEIYRQVGLILASTLDVTLPYEEQISKPLLYPIVEHYVHELRYGEYHWQRDAVMTRCYRYLQKQSTRAVSDFHRRPS